ncbi:MAG TPA: anti-sigma factor [Actinomycetota bacterium]|nr:anti-sigma factor [Actinomycetota bacterium]
MTHEDLKALIAPYVLGAVSPEEEREVRSHIMSCEDCMQEAESYAGAAAALALAVDEAPLPSGFEDAVLAKVEESRPAPGAAPAAAPWWARWSKPLLAGASLAVVACVVLAGAFLAARGQLQQYEDAIPPLVHGEGMRLSGPGGAVARMVPTAEGATLFATGLDAAPDRHTYQLWLMECTDPDDMETCDPTSAGTFDVTGGIAVLETGTGLEGYDRAAVTVEPEGGSEAPTTQPVIDSLRRVWRPRSALD